MTIADRAAVIAVGLVLIVPAAGAAWKAASLKPDTYKSWHDRVDIIRSGLTEKAATELLRLQSLIADVVPSMTPSFDPFTLTKDPSELLPLVRTVQRLIVARGSATLTFERLLRVGPRLLAAVAFYTIGVILTTLSYAGLLRPAPLRVSGWVIGVAGLIAMLSLFALYAYYNHRLSGAEMLSSSANSNG